MSRTKRFKRQSVALAAVAGIVLQGVPAWAEWVYHQAAYTGVNSGTVVLETAGTDQVLQTLVSTLGLTYAHAAMIVSSDGSTRVEKYQDLTTYQVPSSSDAEDTHSCSRVLSPYRLQRTYPGNQIYAGRDASPSGSLAIWTGASCSVPYWGDEYHMNGIKHHTIQPSQSGYFVQDLYAGMCTTLLRDNCGVPQNLVWRSPDAHFATATAAFDATYGYCMQHQSNIPWYAGLFCGGVSNSLFCMRAANQVLDELAWKAAPENFYDGQIDYSEHGPYQYLGAAKQNFRMAPYSGYGANGYCPLSNGNSFESWRGACGCGNVNPTNNPSRCDYGWINETQQFAVNVPDGTNAATAGYYKYAPGYVGAWWEWIPDPCSGYGESCGSGGCCDGLSCYCGGICVYDPCEN
jgi:hypothetical protein